MNIHALIGGRGIIITVKEKLLAFAMTCTLRSLLCFVSLAAEILGLIGSSSWRGGEVVECLVCKQAYNTLYHVHHAHTNIPKHRQLEIHSTHTHT